MASDVIKILGLQHRTSQATSPIRLIARIKGGLPVKTVHTVAALLAPNDARFKYRLVAKASLDRRREKNKLTPAEGTRVARLAKVWSMARDVWGSDDAARDFLFRSHPMAEDGRPIDLVIESEFGAELIVGILGRLKYGAAA
jgi:putative toxin-antitoxin system antitoxin component (TIGR02293 family)